MSSLSQAIIKVIRRLLLLSKFNAKDGVNTEHNEPSAGQCRRWLAFTKPASDRSKQRDDLVNTALRLTTA
jgi:hypothetical protein